MARKRTAKERKPPKRRVVASSPTRISVGRWGGIFDREVTLRGQKYYFYKSSIRLSSAKKMAKELTRKGYRTRIIVAGRLSGYGVYSYPKV